MVENGPHIIIPKVILYIRLRFVQKNWDGVIKVTYLDELTSANELKQLCDGVWVECAYGVCWELKPGHFAHIDCSAM